MKQWNGIIGDTEDFIGWGKFPVGDGTLGNMWEQIGDMVGTMPWNGKVEILGDNGGLRIWHAGYGYGWKHP